LPHSEISGSKPVSGSPKLIAAVHVLHRLSLPRHPPCALSSLTISLRHALSSHAGFEHRACRSRDQPHAVLSCHANTLFTASYIWTRYSVVRERWVEPRLLPEFFAAGDRSSTHGSRSRWSHASWRSRDTSHQLASASHIVGQGRLELPTSRLSGVRSNHLSYWPLPRGKRASCQTARRCPEASYTPLERKAHPGRTCARHRSPESPEQAERLNALGPWKLNRTYAAPARRWCQPGLRPALVVVTVVVLAAAEASAGTP
jgi:hypothetical protein